MVVCVEWIIVNTHFLKLASDGVRDSSAAYVGESVE